MCPVKKTPKEKFVKELLMRLKKRYPKTDSPLDHSNELEMLIAVIMSAQCTDERVNIVTKDLFSKYKTLKDYLNADLEEFRKDIRSINFYRNKGKHILATCEIIANEFNGKVPSTMEQLLTLPGVSRKTANVMLFHVFCQNIGVIVDTHVLRLSMRFGLTKEEKPVKVEQDLMAVLPQKEWGNYSLRTIFHGRTLCKARNPQCEKCFLNDICPSAII